MLNFEQRYQHGHGFELSLKERIEDCDWEVSWTAIEQISGPVTLAVLHKIHANLKGPDFTAAKDPFVYAIDAKTAMPRLDGQTHIPGLGTFTIDNKALHALENYTGQTRIPTLFALDDQDGAFMTPHQVRIHGHLSGDGKFRIVCAVDGRSFTDLFGETPPSGQAAAA